MASEKKIKLWLSMKHFMNSNLACYVWVLQVTTEVPTLTRVQIELFEGMKMRLLKSVVHCESRVKVVLKQRENDL